MPTPSQLRSGILITVLCLAGAARAAPAARAEPAPAQPAQMVVQEKPPEAVPELKPTPAPTGLRFAADVSVTLQYLAQSNSRDNGTTERASGTAFGLSGEVGFVNWLQPDPNRGLLKHLGIRVGLGVDVLDAILGSSVALVGDEHLSPPLEGGALFRFPLHVGVQTFLDESVVGNNLRAIILGVDYQLGLWVDPGNRLSPFENVAHFQPMALNFHATFPNVPVLISSSRLKTNVTFGIPIAGTPFFIAAGVGLGWQ